MESIKDTIKGYTLQAFLGICSTDFKFFCEKVLHLNIAPFHIEWANMFYSNRRSVVQAFRASGKTTVCGVAFAIWLMMFDDITRKSRKNEEPLKFLIVSSMLDHSKKILRDVKGFIENSELLHFFLYPENTRKNSTSWTKTEIKTKNHCWLFCKAYNEGIRSEHVNYILLEEAELFIDRAIYTRAILPMVGAKRGHIMAIGTPLSEIDLLYKCMYEDPKYVRYYYDNDVKSNGLPVRYEGKPTWAYRYNNDEINELEKELGPVEFPREFMCEMSSDDARVISSSALVQSYDQTCRLQDELTMDGFPVKQVNNGNEITLIPYRTMGVDLASSPEGDYTVAIVLEQIINQRYMIRAIFRERVLTKHDEWIHRIYETFKPSYLGIDLHPFGRELVLKLTNEWNVPCETFKFTPENRSEAIHSVASRFQNGSIVMPRDRDHPYTQVYTDILVHELSMVVHDKTPKKLETYTTRSKHDDCLMALAIACSRTVVGGGSSFYSVSWGSVRGDV